jgi:hypothetical protein
VTLAGAVGIGACRAERPQPTDEDPSSGAEPCPGFEGKTVRWIVPNAPGGGFDSEARLIEPFLARRLGAQVLVDNVPGAAGIVGARTVKTAVPDGLTIGSLGVPGLLAAALTGETDAPDPSRDFAVLGRVSRSWHVWAVGASSPIRTLDELIARAETKPITFAISEVSSASFVSITISGALLGAPVEVVPGFGGTREASLAAVRGDVDCVCFNFDTIVDLIDANELRPILQVSATAVAEHSSLDAAALLGGVEGQAARYARSRGEEPAQAREMADILTEFMSAGRVIVAPRGLEASVQECLQSRLFEALSDPRLADAARSSLDVASADVATASVRAAADRSVALVPIIRSAIRKVRS